jgi:hypothetical protein
MTLPGPPPNVAMRLPSSMSQDSVINWRSPMNPWSPTNISHRHEPEVSDDVSQERMKRLLSDSEAALRHALAFRHMGSLRRIALNRPHYNPNQPRVPAGNPDGGQWTSDSDDTGGIAAAEGHTQSISSQPGKLMNDGGADSINRKTRVASRTRIIIDPEVVTGISTIQSHGRRRASARY